MISFQEKGVLITGAGRGIGKRLAIGFAQARARVGLLARSQPELDLAKLEIEHAGGVALRIRADVRDFEQMSAGVERMQTSFGGVQALVCAAAVQGHVGPFAESRPKQWHDVVESNLYGVMHACRAVLPHMIKRRSGKIIVLTCAGALLPRPNFAVYAATKTAVIRFVESVADEVRDDNVQINCLDPGSSYTSMTDEILKAGERAGTREIQDAEQARLTGGVAPDTQIQLALFLASESSNHITGKLFDVHDDWKKIEHQNMRADAYTLRRHLK